MYFKVSNADSLKWPFKVDILHEFLIAEYKSYFSDIYRYSYTYILSKRMLTVMVVKGMQEDRIK